jgi:hypothetical protein
MLASDYRKAIIIIASKKETLECYLSDYETCSNAFIIDAHNTARAFRPEYTNNFLLLLVAYLLFE